MLREPIKINSLTLKNRLVQPPMATEQSDDGRASAAFCDFYAARAGAIGLIIAEHAYVLKEGKASKGQLSVGPDADMDGLKRVAEAVHKKGVTRVFAQINHAGQAAKAEVTGMPVIDIDDLTADDFQRLRDGFVQAALRVQAAGFDGVEIHGAHGYLNSQLYSPLKNHRRDEYGCESIENRTRLACEILAATRAAVGADYPIAYRFGACDYQEGGATEAEAPVAAKLFEAAGCDLLDISGGINGFVIRGVTEPGWFGSVSRAIRTAVRIPVLLTGGVVTGEQAEKLLNEGKADLIGVGRAILRDADWALEQL